MKIKKRVLPMLLSLCLCLGLGKLCIPSAFAADLTYAVTGGNLYFDAQTGTITKSDKTITEADIPAEIYGVPVTAIGNSAFYNRTELTRVTIPNSVTTLGGWVFRGCPKLTELVIPDSVTQVGGESFNGSGLTQVTIGRGLKTIPAEMFFGCSHLKSITIPDNVTKIGKLAFFGCKDLTSVTIPNSVTRIGEEAFCRCEGLTSVTISDSVTEIDSAAFSYCTSLKDVRLSNRLSAISSSTFKGCSTLEYIDIPGSVKSIGHSAFESCSSLKAVTIPTSVIGIGNRAFGKCDALTDAYYGGNALRWSQVETDYMDKTNGGLDKVTIHFNESAAGFQDVFVNDYYADAVAWAVKNNVTSGTSANTFSPANTVTRAQAMAFLWRAAGSPEPSSLASPFTDVADTGAYYYKPILWAAEQGITSGISKTQFGVNNPVAYDQMLAFLARFAGANTGSGDWSANTVNWAANAGLTEGLSFSAKDACPRSDVVYFLWKQLA